MQTGPGWANRTDEDGVQGGDRVAPGTPAIALPTVGVRYEVRHSPFTGSFDDVGYLRTRFTATTPTALGQDIPILDTVGAGTFIGVTASFAGDLLRSYLEGDERIYVDDSCGTPVTVPRVFLTAQPVSTGRP